MHPILPSPGKLLLVICLSAAAGWPWQALTGRATVKKDSVVVYFRMSTASEAVKTLKKGDVVTVDFSVAGAEGAWCSVLEEGKAESSGYVLCRDLKQEQPPRATDSSSRTVPPSGSPIHFRFNPPDGTSLVLKLKSTKVKQLGTGRRVTDVGEARIRVVIRKTPNGFSYKQTMLSAEMFRNGRKIPGSPGAWLEGLVLSYELDENGQVLAVAGAEEALGKLKELAPPAASEWLSSLFSGQAMANSAAYEWNARIGSFVGLQVRSGEVWTQMQQMPIPGGSLASFRTTTRLGERVKCSLGDCVQISFSYGSEPGSLNAAFDTLMAGLSRVVGLPGSIQIDDIGITGEGQRLVDPDTMLIDSETLNRTIRIRMKLPGRGSGTATFTETREYRFDYSG